jgi:hypothetical protein
MCYLLDYRIFLLRTWALALGKWVTSLVNTGVWLASSRYYFKYLSSSFMSVEIITIAIILFPNVSDEV